MHLDTDMSVRAVVVRRETHVEFVVLRMSVQLDLSNP